MLCVKAELLEAKGYFLPLQMQLSQQQLQTALSTKTQSVTELGGEREKRKKNNIALANKF